jgi:hypothetical protein
MHGLLMDWADALIGCVEKANRRTKKRLGREKDDSNRCCRFPKT